MLKELNTTPKIEGVVGLNHETHCGRIHFGLNGHTLSHLVSSVVFPSVR